jgi:hypothetical protein
LHATAKLDFSPDLAAISPPFLRAKQKKSRLKSISPRSTFLYSGGCYAQFHQGLRRISLLYLTSFQFYSPLFLFFACTSIQSPLGKSFIFVLVAVLRNSSSFVSIQHVIFEGIWIEKDILYSFLLPD